MRVSRICCFEVSFVLVIALAGLSAGGCVPSEKVVAPVPEPRATLEPTRLPTPTATPTVSRRARTVAATPVPTITLAAIREERRVITVEAEGLSLNYSQGLYWDERQFDWEYDVYSADKAKYVKDFVEAFSKDFLKPAGLQATDWQVSFRSEYELETDKATYSTLFHCKVDGAASGPAESPYFRSEWLLRPILGTGIDLYAFKYAMDKTTLVYEGEIEHTPIAITFGFPKPISHCHYHIWYEH